MVFGQEISFATKGFSDIKNVTDEARKIVTQSGIRAGIVTVSVIGSTASVNTIEYESALVQDVQRELEKWDPRTLHSLHSQTWGDDNGFSHIRATFLGPSVTLPVVEHQIALDT